MAIENIKRESRLREIGVVRGQGFDAGTQALQKTKRAADNIIDTAFRYGADKVSKEALYDAKDIPLDYKEEYYVESPTGDKRITDVVDDNENIIGSFKTPITNDRLPSGKIYNTAYNNERDKIVGLSIKASAVTFADQMYVQYHNDSEGFVAAVDTYLEKVKENVGPNYQNDIELLEAEVFSTYYKQIGMRELQEQMNTDAHKLLTSFQTLKESAIKEIKNILPSVDPIGNDRSMVFEWNAEESKIELFVSEQYEGEWQKEKVTGDAASDNYLSLYGPLHAQINELNKSITDINTSTLLSPEKKISEVNLLKRDLATNLIQNLIDNAVSDDAEPIEGQISLFQLQEGITGTTDNAYINSIKDFVGNNQTIINQWEEKVNGQRLIMNGINNASKDNIKILMEVELMEDLNFINGLLAQGEHNPQYLVEKERLLKKWGSIEKIFAGMDLGEETKAMFQKYIKTGEGEHLLQSIIGNVNNQTIMNNGTFLRLLKEFSIDWTSGHVIDFLMLGEDAEAINNWADDLLKSEDFLNQKPRYQAQIVSKIVTKLNSIDSAAAQKLADIWMISGVLSTNINNGIGYSKGNSTDSTWRNQADEYINYHDNEKKLYTHPIYGVDPSTQKIRGSDEKLLLKFIANTNVLPTTEYDWLNGIVHNTLNDEKSIELALQQFHFFKKVQNLSDFSGGNVGFEITASLNPEALSMFHMIDRQLQNYSPDNKETLMKAIKDRINFDYNRTQNNAFSETEYYGTSDGQQTMFENSDVWRHLVKGATKVDTDMVWTSEAKHTILEIYKTNRFKGFDRQAAMDSAITHTLFFQWQPSKYGFSAMSSLGGWKEDANDVMMAHLPVELFFGGHDTDGDGKPDFTWLENHVLKDFVTNADWDFIGGINIEDVEEKKEVASAYGLAATKMIPAHTNYQILKYPDNPKAGYINLVLGENLFLKASPNVYNKGYPKYELYFKQPDVGQVYWGQLKKLTNKDGEPFLIDFGVKYEELNKERWHQNLKDAKDMRLEWLTKPHPSIQYTDDGVAYILPG